MRHRGPGGQKGPRGRRCGSGDVPFKVANSNHGIFFPFREALDALGLRRYCCRRMVLTHVDLVEQLIHYSSACDIRLATKP